MNSSNSEQAQQRVGKAVGKHGRDDECEVWCEEKEGQAAAQPNNQSWKNESRAMRAVREKRMKECKVWVETTEEKKKRVKQERHERAVKKAKRQARREAKEGKQRRMDDYFFHLG